METQFQPHNSVLVQQSQTQSHIQWRRQEIQRLQKLYEFDQVMDYLNALNNLFEFIGQKTSQNDDLINHKFQSGVNELNYEMVLLQEALIEILKEKMSALYSEFMVTKDKLSGLEKEYQVLLDMKTVQLQHDFQIVSFNRMNQNAIDEQKKLNKKVMQSIEEQKQSLDRFQHLAPREFIGKDGLQCRIEENKIELKVDDELFVLECDNETREWSITSGQVNANRLMNEYNIHKNIHMLMKSLKLLVEQNRLKQPYF